eukprot:CAMPEP_0180660536 /NCGR_PEP_ID=MMETSP1037_2-20121125/58298_1 /TAXON_ID=632150 /ORGANISM="Azadinium spinosum, Strain 3D9" /LENGTH=84 /DNA_ID=CAMNT_0022687913 /DNA_START=249 /DNA_END=503 /DNA_ORIENTATION=-
MAAEENAWVLGRIAQPTKSIKNACNGSCGCVVQTLVAWTLLCLCNVDTAGEYDTFLGAITIAMFFGEFINLLIASGGKKVTKTA